MNGAYNLRTVTAGLVGAECYHRRPVGHMVCLPVWLLQCRACTDS